MVLIGHSAGAHLCALTTLFLIDAREELFIEVTKQRDVMLAIRGVIGKQITVMVTSVFYAEKILFSETWSVSNKDNFVSFKLLMFISFCDL